VFKQIVTINISLLLCEYSHINAFYRVDVRGLDQIRTIARNQEIPHEGPFCDLMWSDPEEIDNWQISPRGAGWLFGSRVTAEVRSKQEK
jgi:diadenosine tetraphosphatase ApaH/serine/threonine PP2A family protein phosphatase